MQVKATTGLTERQFDDLVTMVARRMKGRPKRGRPPKLDLAERVRLTVEHLRTNASQEVLAAHYAVTQPTVSRVIKTLLPLIDKALVRYDRGLTELLPQESLIVDGTVVPTGRRAGVERLYNGKHKIHGVNVQILARLDGSPVWASPPMPGADHDMTCFAAHKLDKIFNTRTGLADAGYQGHGTTGLITPVKRKPGLDLTEHDETFNRNLAAQRALVERVNAWLKSFQILNTRYRRNWHDLELTIRATFRLLRYRTLT
jgi:transposase